MSNVSNIHDVVSYDAKKSVAFSGQRLSKVTYKTDKETGKKKESKCVSIPVVSSAEVQENLSVLMPAILNFLQGQQDMIVRNLVDSGATVISSDAISPVAIAAYADSETTGNRLTKESIAAWFDGSVAANLRDAFTAKLGDTMKVEAVIAQYKDKFAALAGGKTAYSPELATKLQNALVLHAGEEDMIAEKFIVRLEKMKVVADDLILGL